MSDDLVIPCAGVRSEIYPPEGATIYPRRAGSTLGVRSEIYPRRAVRDLHACFDPRRALWALIPFRGEFGLCSNACFEIPHLLRSSTRL